VNSKQKGKRGELQFAAYLRSRGCEARRGQQFSGGNNSPDVVHNLDAIHFEVKRCERSSPYEWLLQAVADAGGKIPVVAHRQNNRDWIAILPMDDLLDLVVKANAT
jgi:Holliday junction resolvase